MISDAKILVVDDDMGMVETLLDILEGSGYTVESANDGYKAIEMIKADSYDVVLMDIKMPGINGVETLKELKRIKPETKVIMMTAFAIDGLVKEAIEEGAVDIVYKPLDIDHLVESIEKARAGQLILIVDDDENMCEVLRDVLMEKGLNVITAHSGRDAIELAKDQEIGILFADVKMPVLNGLETFLAIKDINPFVKAIMITGYRQEADEIVKEALDNDAYTCLYKPIDMDKLLKIVGEIIERS